MSSLFTKIIDLLFPPKCIFCQGVMNVGARPLICSKCVIVIPKWGEVCPKCKGNIVYEHGNPECYTCQVAGRYYNGAFSYYKYSGLARDALLKYKFSHRIDLGVSLAYMPSAQLSKIGINNNSIDYILYVPTDKGRLKKRGFNHTKLLALSMSKTLNIPVRDDILEKVRSTKLQHTLNSTDRVKNVKGAYAVTDKQKVKGMKILLVDDIFTTGFTTIEISRILKRAGASYVFVVAIAAGEQ